VEEEEEEEEKGAEEEAEVRMPRQTIHYSPRHHSQRAQELRHSRATMSHYGS
jgi:hypothetical protein